MSAQLKCPECGAWTDVLETRYMKDNAVYRRRECANNHRFTTHEKVITQKESHARKLGQVESLSASNWHGPEAA
jgi:transcriptional regulator NrdR family protein